MLYAIWDYTCRNETGVYVLTGKQACPEHANCVECPALKKWKFESCQTGYVDDGNGTCRPLDQGCTTGVLKEYPLTSCPDGAICAYTGCDGRYKIDHCQDDYELQDATCKCHKEMHVRGELAGKYSCACAMGWDDNMCMLEVNMENTCEEYGDGSSSCDDRHYVNKAWSLDYRFWLNFDYADALGIKVDELAQTRTSFWNNVFHHYGYRSGVNN